MIKPNALYLFLDDIREMNFSDTNTHFDHCYLVRSVNGTKQCVIESMSKGINEIRFDLDHDLGDYASQGGDAIKLVDWLIEEFHDKDVNFKFHFHSMNPVGVQNMRNAVEGYWAVF